MADHIQNWLIVGASRGIGFEYVQQLLAKGHHVYATARCVEKASQLRSLKENYGTKLHLLQCDMTSSESIEALQVHISRLVSEEGIKRFEGVVLNAGILEYPGRISEIKYDDFVKHMNTNCVGPLVCAASILALPKEQDISRENKNRLDISNLVFISSDSGSAANFRAFEDGFGAYAASKAALNQGLRHLAVEATRLLDADKAPTVLAIHPGEVSTDMAANVELEWEVEGIITPQESVEKMLNVIQRKGRGGAEEIRGKASFWDWEGREYPW